MSTRGAAKLEYDCTQCVAYCCSIYERVEVKAKDLKRLAAYFGVTEAVASKKYTKLHGKERILRRTPDVIFEKTCMFLDQKTRGCTIYDARPAVCREYPGEKRCGYYDVLSFEQRVQDDVTVVPVVRLVFKKKSKKTKTVQLK